MLSTADAPSDGFYERLGGDSRVYFYRIDTRGNLYMEQTLNQVAAKLSAKGDHGFTGRNIANALKDPKFLRFFYARLQPSGSLPLRGMLAKVLPEGNVCGVDVRAYCAQYAYVSLCGRELNFVRPDDALSALGFSELLPSPAPASTSSPAPAVGTEREMEIDAGSGFELSYGGAADLREPFRPAELRLSQATQRLYHPLSRHRRLGQGVPLEMAAATPVASAVVGVALSPCLGLLHPHLAGALMADAQEGPAEQLLLHFEGQQYPVLLID